MEASGKIRDSAIAALREETQLRPDHVNAHMSLGHALSTQGKHGEASAECRTALTLKPDLAAAHVNLGNALNAQGKRDEAIAESRTAIKLKPDLAEAHFNLGIALGAQGKLDEAIAEFRTGLTLKPDDATVHMKLGNGLRVQGKLDEAIAEFRTAVKLNPNIRGASWPAHVEALAAVAPRLPALLKGQDRSRDAAEALALAEMMHWTQHYAQAARLYRETFAAHPELADGVHPGNRFDAACAAARAGAVQGQDKPPLDEPEKARWRKQALDWLREHLAMHASQLKDPKERGAVPGYLRAWQTDADLAGTRDREALKKIPADERRAWEALWKDVDALLKGEARPGPAGSESSGTAAVRPGEAPAGSKPSRPPQGPLFPRRPGPTRPGHSTASTGRPTLSHRRSRPRPSRCSAGRSRATARRRDRTGP